MAGRGGSCLEPHLKRIRALSAQALHALCADRESLPSDARVERVTQDLHDLLQYTFNMTGSASVWSSIGGPHLAGLVALYGFAVRRSVQPDVPFAERDAYTALRSILAAHLGRLYKDCNPVDTRSPFSMWDEVAAALAGTHAFRCYSAILAGLASELGAASASGSRHLGLRALGVLKETVALLELLVLPDDIKKSSVEEEIRRELIGSHLLEYFSRVLLMASRCDGAAAEAAAVMKRLMAVLESWLICSRDGRLYMSRASLAYLLISHVVGLAAALDGGRTYGMPSGPGAIVAPLFTTCGRPLRQHSADLADATMACQVLSEWEQSLRNTWFRLGQPTYSCADSLAEMCARRLPVLQSRVAELNARKRAAKTTGDLTDELLNAPHELETALEVMAGRNVPPYNVAATWDVSMRLADCAVVALAAAAGEDPRPQQQLEEEQQHRPRVNPTQAAELGVQALLCARCSIWNVGREAEAVTPPLKRAQLERWWSLAARMIDLVSKSPVNGDRRKLPKLPCLLILNAKGNEGPLSPEPSLDVATALRAGYMRAEELLLRRPTAGDSRRSDALMSLYRNGWAQVLAFAEPADVASLAASVAKTVRRSALRLSSALDTLRSELAASGIREDDSEYSTRYVEGRDNSRIEQLPGVRDEVRQAYNQARLLMNCAQQALNPGSDRQPFVQVLLEVVGRTGESAAAAMEVAVSGGVNTLNAEECVQPGSSTADGAGTQLGIATSISAGSEGELTVPVARATGSSAVAFNGTTGEAGGGAGAPAAADCARPNRARLDRAGSIGRLTLALAQLAVRLMPEVTRLADILYGCWYHRSDDPTYVSACQLATALSWVPLLAAAVTATAGDEVECSQSEQWCTTGKPSSGSLGTNMPQASATAAAAARAAPTPPSALSADPAAAWDRFLWSEVRLPELLGLALRVVELQHTNKDLVNESVEEAWVRAMWALLRLAPARLASVLREGSDQAGDAAQSSRPRRHLRYPLSLPRARALLGRGGALPQPELLAALEGVCAGDAGLTSLGLDCPLTEEELQAWVAAAALLPSPGEVLSVLPTCGNPLCTNLEGDSEADLKLSGCARCGGRVRYCSRECQVEHWKAGHKAECGRG